MPERVAIICLGRGAKLAPSEFQRDLRENWPSLPAVTRPQMSGNNKREIFGEVGNSRVTISVVAAPVAWAELLEPCENSALWNDAAGQLRGHRGHLVIEVNGDLEPVTLVTLLTQVTASLAGTAFGVLGVYWKHAEMVVYPDVFRHFAIEIMAEGPPLPIWVNTRVWKSKDGLTCGFTTGMTSLGLIEIEAVGSTETPSWLQQRFHGLAYDLVENGLTVQDGDILGRTTNEQIRIQYTNSSFARPEKVVKLNYEEFVPAKKGWFRSMDRPPTRWNRERSALLYSPGRG